jgi:hypothetical protein
MRKPAARFARFARLAPALLMLAGLAGCGRDGAPEASDDQPRRTTIADGPRWSDVTGLARSADAVLLGVVTGVAARELDTGGDASGDGVPMTFFTFRVDQVFAGSPAAGGEVVVGWLDTDKMQTLPPTSELARSQRLVLFATFLTDEETPGLHQVGDIYVPLGFDFGVLDARDQVAMPRRSEVTSLRPGGPVADEWPLSEILRVSRAAATG